MPEPAIHIDGLTVRYGRFTAVDGLDLEIRPGELFGLLGPNGAGKTTTLRALAGILTPTQGRILIDGHDIVDDPVAAKRSLCYVPDDPKLFDTLTVWEHLRFVAAAYRLGDDWKGKAETLLDQFELTEKRNALASDLSRGMRQKVAIACGYLHEPRAILLDEPLTGLDPRGIRTMKETVRRRAADGAALLISSHLLSLVEDICTDVVMFHRGRVILSGSLEELHRQAEAEGRSETLEDLFLRLTEEEKEPHEATTEP
jgi:ABC-2 type transport system ATP-binding protein